MPKGWTKARREAQSRAMKAHWAEKKARKKRAKQKAEPNYLGGQQHSTSFDVEQKPAPQPWWRRVMLALGFRHGA